MLFRSSIEWGKVGTPPTVVDDLTAALTQTIEELTRPVDAIKHQAKTVTVGISRSDDTLLQSDLVQAVLGAGVPRDNLGYRVLRTLVALDPAIAEVIGTIRYRIDGDPATDDATIAVLDRTGIGATYPSRTETDPRLRGTKQLTAAEREVTVAIGRRDGRTVVLVPEVKGTQTVGLTLLHVELHDHLAPHVLAQELDESVRVVGVELLQKRDDPDDERGRVRALLAVDCHLIALNCLQPAGVVVEIGVHLLGGYVSTGNWCR